MESKEGPTLPAGFQEKGGLPHSQMELRMELLRRLDLLNREIRALDTVRTRRLFSTTAETLRLIERELRERLGKDLDFKTWPESRVEILAIWRQYRRTFETLAAQCRQTFPARPGQRDRGPRW